MANDQARYKKMKEDDERPTDNKKRVPKKPDVPALPAQLGQKLRALFADMETQPIPDRLVELVEQLAAKEKKTE
jgi:hypothetical protein